MIHGTPRLSPSYLAPSSPPTSTGTPARAPGFAPPGRPASRLPPRKQGGVGEPALTLRGTPRHCPQRRLPAPLRRLGGSGGGGYCCWDDTPSERLLGKQTSGSWWEREHNGSAADMKKKKEALREVPALSGPPLEGRALQRPGKGEE